MLGVVIFDRVGADVDLRSVGGYAADENGVYRINQLDELPQDRVWISNLTHMQMRDNRTVLSGHPSIKAENWLGIAPIQLVAELMGSKEPHMVMNSLVFVHDFIRRAVEKLNLDTRFARPLNSLIDAHEVPSGISEPIVNDLAGPTSWVKSRSVGSGQGRVWRTYRQPRAQWFSEVLRMPVPSGRWKKSPVDEMDDAIAFFARGKAAPFTQGELVWPWISEKPREYLMSVELPPDVQLTSVQEVWTGDVKPGQVPFKPDPLTFSDGLALEMIFQARSSGVPVVGPWLKALERCRVFERLSSLDLPEQVFVSGYGGGKVVLVCPQSMSMDLDVYMARNGWEPPSGIELPADCGLGPLSRAKASNIRTLYAVEIYHNLPREEFAQKMHSFVAGE